MPRLLRMLEPPRPLAPGNVGAQTLAAVRVLAGKSTTVDVDEEALALAVVEGLAPVLAAATDPERVTAALVDAIPPALAAQVVDALSARLAASS